MLSKIIKMEDIKDGFVNNNNKGHYQSDMLDIALFMQYTIDLLKMIVNRQKKLEGTLDGNYRNLANRIKKLEQAKTYYPMTEKEVRNIKVGGTD